MKVFDSDRVRNLAVVGHGDAGKTSLVSACLFSANAVTRLGKVDDGNTVTDYDEDEIERQVTINTALAHCEWKQTKLNLLDTPGYRAFILDAKACMLATETSLVVVDAVAGTEVQTEKVWSFAQELGLSQALVLNRLDCDNASFSRALDSLREAFGRAIIPVQLPLGEEKDFRGVIDLIHNKAYVYPTDGSGSFQEQPIPEEFASSAEEYREELIEMVAENDDELLERFFEEGTLEEGELLTGLKKSLAEKKIHPLFCTAASLNIGVKQLLDAAVEWFPSPLAGRSVRATPVNGDEPEELPVQADGPTSALVFKTLADPFAGRISLVKVFSGTLASDSSIRNLNRDSDERLGNLQIPQGKNHQTISEVGAGDICAVLKLKDTTTGDTLADRSFGYRYQPVEFPEPAISFAVEPRSRGDEDKIGSAIARIIEEDPSVRFRRDPQTREFLLSGTGQLHIEVVVGKLKRKFGVQVNLNPPKVPYRETIMGTADVQGRYKKQTGGHGQYGACKIRMEPLSRDAGFEFQNEIFGGSIPRQYIPAVEKGIVEAAAKGFLAGYPVVDFKVVLYDGSYHDVDSSELAFKIAASLAFKQGMDQARAVLLEPLVNLEVYLPEENAGDIIGDLNARRGRITGMDVKGGTQIVSAQVPLAEVLNYSPNLNSMTGGRGSFHVEHSHYDVVPQHLSEKIIAGDLKENQEKSA